MKNTLLITLFISICFFATSCSKDEESNDNSGTLTFIFNVKSSSLHKASNFNLNDTSTTTPSAIIISITDNTGKLVVNTEKIPLYNMNGNFISKPILLDKGNYKLSDFLVIDENNNVLYLAPKEGSPKAYLVLEPLPIEFSVSKDLVTNVNVEVLKNTGETPEEYGYTTFTFNIIDTFSIYLSVFTYSDTTQQLRLSNSNIDVYKNDSKVYSGKIYPITNCITLKNETGNYKIIIQKEGYNTSTSNFTLSDLQKYTATNPFIVVLTKGSIDLSNGLVAYYPFNGNANDESGNNHNGTIYGNASLTSDRHDKANSAYLFDGIDDYINTFSTFDYQYRTVSLWVYSNDIHGTSPYNHVIFAQDSPSLSYGLLGAAFEDGYLGLHAGGAGSSEIFISHEITENRWFHFVLVRNGNENRYYINSLLVGTTQANALTSTFEPNNYLVIGTGRSTNKQFFIGKIDDLAIYNRVLSNEEIQALYSK